MDEQVKTGNRASLLATSTALSVLAVGWVDYWTGAEVSVSILYLLPIYLGTWHVGHRWGLVIASASAMAWLAADSAAGQRWGHPLVPYWNAAVLLGLFWVVVYLLSALKTSQEGLEGEVERRTSALRREITERTRAEDRLTQAVEWFRRGYRDGPIMPGLERKDGNCRLPACSIALFLLESSAPRAGIIDGGCVTCRSRNVNGIPSRFVFLPTECRS